MKLCNKFIDIKKSWIYLLKEYKDNKNSEIFIIERYFVYFLNIKNVIKINKIRIKYENILGREDKNYKYDTKTFIFLIDYYLMMNDLFIYENNIYKKIENSMISFKKTTNINEIYDNFKDILMYFKTNFSFHFDNFNIIDFLGSNLINKEDKIKRLVDFTSYKIKPDYNIMEFTDGVYFINNNKFLRKDKFLIKNNISLENFLNENKNSTIKHYNFSFNNLSEPKKWLEGLEKILRFKEIKTKKDKILNLFQQNEDAKWLLIYIAYIFHYSTNELKKKSTLYIWGQSNTGKTTMIINPLINYFGKENVGLMSNNKNFEFQHIEKKKLIILDEFDFSKVNIDNFKKLLSGELLLSEKKNKDPIILEHTPIIISSNQNPEYNLNMFDKTPITNRLKAIHFKNQILENEQENDIKEQILREEAKIIVYCNRVYFNWIKKEKTTKKNQKLL